MNLQELTYRHGAWQRWTMRHHPSHITVQINLKRMRSRQLCAIKYEAIRMTTIEMRHERRIGHRHRMRMSYSNISSQHQPRTTTAVKVLALRWSRVNMRGSAPARWHEHGRRRYNNIIYSPAVLIVYFGRQSIGDNASSYFMNLVLAFLPRDAL